MALMMPDGPFSDVMSTSSRFRRSRGEQHPRTHRGSTRGWCRSAM